MGLKELPVRELYFCDSTGLESLPTETSCRSGNCARILVSKLSESGKTTFSVDHHDDASSKTTCGETYALFYRWWDQHTSPPFLLLIVPSPVKIHRIAFFSNFVRPVEDKDVANAPEVMNPYADQRMFKGDVCEAGDPVSELRQLLEKHEEKSSDDFESLNLGSDDDPKLVRTGYTIPRKEKRRLRRDQAQADRYLLLHLLNLLSQLVVGGRSSVASLSSALPGTDLPPLLLLPSLILERNKLN